MLRDVSNAPGSFLTCLSVISLTRVPPSSRITALRFPSTCRDSPTVYMPFLSFSLISVGKWSKSGNKLYSPATIAFAYCTTSPSTPISTKGKSLTISTTAFDCIEVVICFTYSSKKLLIFVISDPI